MREITTIQARLSRDSSEEEEEEEFDEKVDEKYTTNTDRPSYSKTSQHDEQTGTFSYNTQSSHPSCTSSSFWTRNLENRYNPIEEYRVLRWNSLDRLRNLIQNQFDKVEGCNFANFIADNTVLVQNSAEISDLVEELFATATLSENHVQVSFMDIEALCELGINQSQLTHVVNQNSNHFVNREKYDVKVRLHENVDQLQLATDNIQFTNLHAFTLSTVLLIQTRKQTVLSMLRVLFWTKQVAGDGHVLAVGRANFTKYRVPISKLRDCVSSEDENQTTECDLAQCSEQISCDTNIVWHEYPKYRAAGLALTDEDKTTRRQTMAHSFWHLSTVCIRRNVHETFAQCRLTESLENYTFKVAVLTICDISFVYLLPLYMLTILKGCTKDAVKQQQHHRKPSISVSIELTNLSHVGHTKSLQLNNNSRVNTRVSSGTILSKITGQEWSKKSRVCRNTPNTSSLCLQYLSHSRHFKNGDVKATAPAARLYCLPTPECRGENDSERWPSTARRNKCFLSKFLFDEWVKDNKSNSQPIKRKDEIDGYCNIKDHFHRPSIVYGVSESSRGWGTWGEDSRARQSISQGVVECEVDCFSASFKSTLYPKEDSFQESSRNNKDSVRSSSVQTRCEDEENLPRYRTYKSKQPNFCIFTKPQRSLSDQPVFHCRQHFVADVVCRYHTTNGSTEMHQAKCQTHHDAQFFDHSSCSSIPDNLSESVLSFRCTDDDNACYGYSQSASETGIPLDEQQPRKKKQRIGRSRRSRRRRRRSRSSNRTTSGSVHSYFDSLVLGDSDSRVKSPNKQITALCAENFSPFFNTTVIGTTSRRFKVMRKNHRICICMTRRPTLSKVKRKVPDYKFLSDSSKSVDRIRVKANKAQKGFYPPADPQPKPVNHISSSTLDRFPSEKIPLNSTLAKVGSDSLTRKPSKLGFVGSIGPGNEVERRARSSSVMPTVEEEEKLRRASVTESGGQPVGIQSVQAFSDSKANESIKATAPIANSITTDPTMAGTALKGHSWNSKIEPTIIRETNAITSLTETNTKPAPSDQSDPENILPGTSSVVQLLDTSKLVDQPNREPETTQGGPISTETSMSVTRKSKAFDSENASKSIASVPMSQIQTEREHVDEENRSSPNTLVEQGGQKTSMDKFFGSSTTKATDEKPSSVPMEIHLDSVNSMQTKPEKISPLTSTDKKVPIVILPTDDEEMEEEQEVTEETERSSISKECVLASKKLVADSIAFGVNKLMTEQNEIWHSSYSKNISKKSLLTDGSSNFHHAPIKKDHKKPSIKQFNNRSDVGRSLKYLTAIANMQKIPRFSKGSSQHLLRKKAIGAPLEHPMDELDLHETVDTSVSNESQYDQMNTIPGQEHDYEPEVGPMENESIIRGQSTSPSFQTSSPSINQPSTHSSHFGTGFGVWISQPWPCFTFQGATTSIPFASSGSSAASPPPLQPLSSGYPYAPFPAVECLINVSHTAPTGPFFPIWSNTHWHQSSCTDLTDHYQQGHSATSIPAQSTEATPNRSPFQNAQSTMPHLHQATQVAGNLYACPLTSFYTWIRVGPWGITVYNGMTACPPSPELEMQLKFEELISRPYESLNAEDKMLLDQMRRQCTPSVLPNGETEWQSVSKPTAGIKPRNKRLKDLSAKTRKMWSEREKQENKLLEEFGFQQKVTSSYSVRQLRSNSQEEELNALLSKPRELLTTQERDRIIELLRDTQTMPLDGPVRTESMINKLDELRMRPTESLSVEEKHLLTYLESLPENRGLRSDNKSSVKHRRTLSMEKQMEALRQIPYESLSAEDKLLLYQLQALDQPDADISNKNAYPKMKNEQSKGIQSVTESSQPLDKLAGGSATARRTPSMEANYRELKAKSKDSLPTEDRQVPKQVERKQDYSELARTEHDRGEKSTLLQLIPSLTLKEQQRREFDHVISSTHMTLGEMCANLASLGSKEDLLEILEGKPFDELTPAERELFMTLTQSKPSDRVQSMQKWPWALKIMQQDVTKSQLNAFREIMSTTSSYFNTHEPTCETDYSRYPPFIPCPCQAKYFIDKTTGQSPIICFWPWPMGSLRESIRQATDSFSQQSSIINSYVFQSQPSPQQQTSDKQMNYHLPGILQSEHTVTPLLSPLGSSNANHSSDLSEPVELLRTVAEMCTDTYLLRYYHQHQDKISHLQMLRQCLMQSCNVNNCNNGRKQRLEHSSELNPTNATNHWDIDKETSIGYKRHSPSDQSIGFDQPILDDDGRDSRMKIDKSDKSSNSRIKQTILEWSDRTEFCDIDATCTELFEVLQKRKKYPQLSFGCCSVPLLSTAEQWFHIGDDIPNTRAMRHQKKHVEFTCDLVDTKRPVSMDRQIHPRRNYVSKSPFQPHYAQTTIAFEQMIRSRFAEHQSRIERHHNLCINMPKTLYRSCRRTYGKPDDKNTFKFPVSYKRSWVCCSTQCTPQDINKRPFVKQKQTAVLVDSATSTEDLDESYYVLNHHQPQTIHPANDNKGMQTISSFQQENFQPILGTRYLKFISQLRPQLSKSISHKVAQCKHQMPNANHVVIVPREISEGNVSTTSLASELIRAPSKVLRKTASIQEEQTRALIKTSHTVNLSTERTMPNVEEFIDDAPRLFEALISEFHGSTNGMQLDEKESSFQPPRHALQCIHAVDKPFSRIKSKVTETRATQTSAVSHLRLEVPSLDTDVNETNMERIAPIQSFSNSLLIMPTTTQPNGQATFKSTNQGRVDSGETKLWNSRGLKNSRRKSRLNEITHGDDSQEQCKPKSLRKLETLTDELAQSKELMETVEKLLCLPKATTLHDQLMRTQNVIAFQTQNGDKNDPLLKAILILIEQYRQSALTATGSSLESNDGELPIPIAPSTKPTHPEPEMVTPLVLRSTETTAARAGTSQVEAARKYPLKSSHVKISEAKQQKTIKQLRDRVNNDVSVDSAGSELILSTRIAEASDSEGFNPLKSNHVLKKGPLINPGINPIKQPRLDDPIKKRNPLNLIVGKSSDCVCSANVLQSRKLHMQCTQNRHGNREGLLSESDSDDDSPYPEDRHTPKSEASELSFDLGTNSTTISLSGSMSSSSCDSPSSETLKHFKPERPPCAHLLYRNVYMRNYLHTNQSPILSACGPQTCGVQTSPVITTVLRNSLQQPFDCVEQHQTELTEASPVNSEIKPISHTNTDRNPKELCICTMRAPIFPNQFSESEPTNTVAPTPVNELRPNIGFLADYQQTLKGEIEKCWQQAQNPENISNEQIELLEALDALVRRSGAPNLLEDTLEKLQSFYGTDLSSFLDNPPQLTPREQQLFRLLTIGWYQSLRTDECSSSCLKSSTEQINILTSTDPWKELSTLYTIFLLAHRLRSDGMQLPFFNSSFHSKQTSERSQSHVDEQQKPLTIQPKYEENNPSADSLYQHFFQFMKQFKLERNQMPEDHSSNEIESTMSKYKTVSTQHNDKLIASTKWHCSKKCKRYIVPELRKISGLPELASKEVQTEEGKKAGRQSELNPAVERLRRPTLASVVRRISAGVQSYGGAMLKRAESDVGNEISDTIPQGTPKQLTVHKGKRKPRSKGKKASQRDSPQRRLKRLASEPVVVIRKNGAETLRGLFFEEYQPNNRPPIHSFNHQRPRQSRHCGIAFQSDFLEAAKRPPDKQENQHFSFDQPIYPPLSNCRCSTETLRRLELTNSPIDHQCAFKESSSIKLVSFLEDEPIKDERLVRSAPFYKKCRDRGPVSSETKCLMGEGSSSPSANIIVRLHSVDRNQHNETRFNLKAGSVQHILSCKCYQCRIFSFRSPTPEIIHPSHESGEQNDSGLEECFPATNLLGLSPTHSESSTTSCMVDELNPEQTVLYTAIPYGNLLPSCSTWTEPSYCHDKQPEDRLFSPVISTCLYSSIPSLLNCVFGSTDRMDHIRRTEVPSSDPSFAHRKVRNGPRRPCSVGSSILNPEANSGFGSGDKVQTLCINMSQVDSERNSNESPSTDTSGPDIQTENISPVNDVQVVMRVTSSRKQGIRSSHEKNRLSNIRKNKKSIEASGKQWVQMESKIGHFNSHKEQTGCLQTVETELESILLEVGSRCKSAPSSTYRRKRDISSSEVKPILKANCLKPHFLNHFQLNITVPTVNMQSYHLNVSCSTETKLPMIQCTGQEGSDNQNASKIPEHAIYLKDRPANRKMPPTHFQKFIRPSSEQRKTKNLRHNLEVNRQHNLQPTEKQTSRALRLKANRQTVHQPSIKPEYVKPVRKTSLLNELLINVCSAVDTEEQLDPLKTTFAGSGQLHIEPSASNCNPYLATGVKYVNRELGKHRERCECESRTASEGYHLMDYPLSFLDGNTHLKPATKYPEHAAMEDDQDTEVKALDKNSRPTTHYQMTEQPNIQRGTCNRSSSRIRSSLQHDNELIEVAGSSDGFDRCGSNGINEPCMQCRSSNKISTVHHLFNGSTKTDQRLQVISLLSQDNTGNSTSISNTIAFYVTRLNSSDVTQKYNDEDDDKNAISFTCSKVDNKTLIYIPEETHLVPYHLYSEPVHHRMKCQDSNSDCVIDQLNFYSPFSYTHIALGENIERHDDCISAKTQFDLNSWNNCNHPGRYEKQIPIDDTDCKSAQTTEMYTSQAHRDLLCILVHTPRDDTTQSANASNKPENSTVMHNFAQDTVQTFPAVNNLVDYAQKIAGIKGVQWFSVVGALTTNEREQLSTRPFWIRTNVPQPTIQPSCSIHVQATGEALQYNVQSTLQNDGAKDCTVVKCDDPQFKIQSADSTTFKTTNQYPQNEILSPTITLKANKILEFGLSSSSNLVQLCPTDLNVRLLLDVKFPLKSDTTNESLHSTTEKCLLPNVKQLDNKQTNFPSNTDPSLQREKPCKQNPQQDEKHSKESNDSLDYASESPITSIRTISLTLSVANPPENIRDELDSSFISGKSVTIVDTPPTVSSVAPTVDSLRKSVKNSEHTFGSNMPKGYANQPEKIGSELCAGMAQEKKNPSSPKEIPVDYSLSSTSSKETPEYCMLTDMSKSATSCVDVPNSDSPANVATPPYVSDFKNLVLEQNTKQAVRSPGEEAKIEPNVTNRTSPTLITTELYYSRVNWLPNIDDPAFSHISYTQGAAYCVPDQNKISNLSNLLLQHYTSAEALCNWLDINPPRMQREWNRKPSPMTTSMRTVNEHNDRTQPKSPSVMHQKDNMTVFGKTKHSYTAQTNNGLSPHERINDFQILNAVEKDTEEYRTPLLTPDYGWFPNKQINLPTSPSSLEHQPTLVSTPTAEPPPNEKSEYSSTSRKLGKDLLNIFENRPAMNKPSEGNLSVLTETDRSSSRLQKAPLAPTSSEFSSDKCSLNIPNPPVATQHAISEIQSAKLSEKLSKNNLSNFTKKTTDYPYVIRTTPCSQTLSSKSSSGFLGTPPKSPRRRWPSSRPQKPSQSENTSLADLTEKGDPVTNKRALFTRSVMYTYSRRMCTRLFPATVDPQQINRSVTKPTETCTTFGTQRPQSAPTGTKQYSGRTVVEHSPLEASIEQLDSDCSQRETSVKAMPNPPHDTATILTCLGVANMATVTITTVVDNLSELVKQLKTLVHETKIQQIPQRQIGNWAYWNFSISSDISLQYVAGSQRIPVDQQQATLINSSKLNNSIDRALQTENFHSPVTPGSNVSKRIHTQTSSVNVGQQADSAQTNQLLSNYLQITTKLETQNTDGQLDDSVCRNRLHMSNKITPIISVSADLNNVTQTSLRIGVDCSSTVPCHNVELNADHNTVSHLLLCRPIGYDPDWAQSKRTYTPNVEAFKVSINKCTEIPDRLQRLDTDLESQMLRHTPVSLSVTTHLVPKYMSEKHKSKIVNEVHVCLRALLAEGEEDYIAAPDDGLSGVKRIVNARHNLELKPQQDPSLSSSTVTHSRVEYDLSHVQRDRTTRKTEPTTPLNLSYLQTENVEQHTTFPNFQRGSNSAPKDMTTKPDCSANPSLERIIDLRHQPDNDHRTQKIDSGYTDMPATSSVKNGCSEKDSLSTSKNKWISLAGCLDENTGSAQHTDSNSDKRGKSPKERTMTAFANSHITAPDRRVVTNSPQSEHSNKAYTFDRVSPGSQENASLDGQFLDQYCEETFLLNEAMEVDLDVLDRLTRLWIGGTREMGPKSAAHHIPTRRPDTTNKQNNAAYWHSDPKSILTITSDFACNRLSRSCQFLSQSASFKHIVTNNDSSLRTVKNKIRPGSRPLTDRQNATKKGFRSCAQKLRRLKLRNFLVANCKAPIVEDIDEGGKLHTFLCKPKTFRTWPRWPLPACKSYPYNIHDAKIRSPSIGHISSSSCSSSQPTNLTVRRNRCANKHNTTDTTFITGTSLSSDIVDK
ncbi:hypothetical protein EG68_02786 [Paragonimus skrjabini miyazakii]|uniref:Uncharacterized protein n=1 Tax=Paragonimus skrjabini miyazakii TaxID=59628 RepID=A0A8S9YZN0_9TREM|nr:hypothetical protein EG68_02786 [Paragonimus skrjabini miyazakii]